MADRVSIRSLDLFYVRPRWQFLRVTTDAGVEGWSEAVLEGNLRSVRAAVESMAEYLVGQDPRAVAHHWRRLYSGNFYRGGPVLTSAISAVDIALWDIKGKLLGAPVYELLGGPVRTAVPVYCHISGANADELIADAKTVIDAGFRLMKTSLTGPAPRLPTRAYVDGEVERFYRLREAIGTSYEFAVDFHGRATPALSADPGPRTGRRPPLVRRRTLLARKPSGHAGYQGLDEFTDRDGRTALYTLGFPGSYRSAHR